MLRFGRAGCRLLGVEGAILDAYLSFPSCSEGIEGSGIIFVESWSRLCREYHDGVALVVEGFLVDLELRRSSAALGSLYFVERR